MKGGYASGKRINMRAVIPYIASGFKKDKIWLRRTQLDKRNYQIIVAIDDSERMKDSGSRRTLFLSSPSSLRCLRKQAPSWSPYQY
jgi:midasin (ATPase involved in ribosome maturation)